MIENKSDSGPSVAADNKPPRSRLAGSKAKAEKAAKEVPVESEVDKNRAAKSGWLQRFLGMEPEGLRAEIERLSGESLQAQADFERASLEAEAAAAALAQEQKHAAALAQALDAAQARELVLLQRLAALEHFAEQARAQYAVTAAERESEHVATTERERVLSGLRAELEQERVASAGSAEREAASLRELEQIRGRLQKLGHAHAALEQVRNSERSMLQLRERELKVRSRQADELTQRCAHLEEDKATLTAAQRRLLDQQEALNAQLDEAQLRLTTQREANKTARAQWLSISLSFWRALERVLGESAPLAVTFATSADEIAGPCLGTPSAVSELEQAFADVGLDISVSLAETHTCIELSLRGTDIASEVGAAPLWFAGVALPHIERALGRKLSVEGATHSGEQELLFHLRARQPSA